LIGIENNYLYC